MCFVQLLNEVGHTRLIGNIIIKNIIIFDLIYAVIHINLYYCPTPYRAIDLDIYLAWLHQLGEEIILPMSHYDKLDLSKLTVFNIYRNHYQTNTSTHDPVPFSDFLIDFQTFISTAATTVEMLKHLNKQTNCLFVSTNS